MTNAGGAGRGGGELHPFHSCAPLLHEPPPFPPSLLADPLAAKVYPNPE